MTWLIRATDGGPEITPEGASLLLGIAVADIEKLWRDQPPGHRDVPDEWLKSGRRRVREASSRIGFNGVVGFLTYWARKDLDAQVAVLDDGVVLR